MKWWRECRPDEVKNRPNWYYYTTHRSAIGTNALTNDTPIIRRENEDVAADPKEEPGWYITLAETEYPWHGPIENEKTARQLALLLEPLK